MGGFVHLHVHTQYSLLDGAARISELVPKAKELGMDALAITDHGVMYGVIDFYKECVKCGVKPILGMEAYVAPRSLYEKEGAREYAHLVLLAKNDRGYKNLIKLSSIAFTEGFYYKPRIDYDLLEQHSEGLICLSACLAGDIPRLLLRGFDAEARALAGRLKNMFGEDFYIEIQNHGIPEQLQVLPKLVALARELDIKLVATNDIHYVSRDDAEAQDALLCVQTVSYMDEPDRMRMSTDEFYLKSPEEMENLFFDYKDALANTAEVADKCDVKLEFGVRHLPNFTAPNGMTNVEFIRYLAETGLKRKMPGADERAHERLEYELSVITKMGFVDYYLIVWDFIDFAHKNGIYVGPGRGSGAASLVAYSLDITDIDPLRYELPFERFLNPERISMPDFDVDFCIERRQEVIDYVVRKYGKDNVAQIITFGTLAAKQVVKDVGRVMRIPLGEVERISKLIPAALNMTLTKAMELSPELMELYKADERVKKLIDLSLKLEGLPRQAGTHAAGVVISEQPIMEYAPLQRNGDIITTQFPKDTIEELGLLKMDFLGLRTLTVIRDTLDFIRAEGKEPPDMSKLDYADPKIFAMISAADTDGVFQLESAGMRQFMAQLKPDNIEDIIAGISLFRPGPMDSIPRYLAGKRDQKNIKYAHEKLIPALKTTYGCMVYQEQVMQIVRDLAGYSMGRSDLVRRAMAKKKHEVMAKEREYFINGIVEDGVVKVPGAVRNGVPESVANGIFDEMTSFSSYAFNKAHAAAYAIVAYRTAYLKLYYPVEFMAAMINSFISALSAMGAYINAAKRMGIKLLSPDINRSYEKFTVEDGSIRFGLAGIKNVGEMVMRDIIAERAHGGDFTSLQDFIERTSGTNKRMIEALIKVGCFDSLGAKRAQLLMIYERVMDAVAARKKNTSTGQMSLFDLGGASMKQAISIQLPNVDEFDKATLLNMEREALGIYLSGHPLLEYSEILNKLKNRAEQFSASSEEESAMLYEGEKITLGGIITNVKKKVTKSGSGLMAYCTLEDLTGSVEMLAFPSIYTRFSTLLVEESKVVITGKLSIRDGKADSILIDSVAPLEKGEAQKKLYIRYDSGSDGVYENVLRLISRFPGDIPVILHDSRTKKTQQAPRSMYINSSEALLSGLYGVVGRENVVMK